MSPASQAYKFPESMSKLHSPQSAVLSNISNLPKLHYPKPNDLPGNNPSGNRNTAGHWYPVKGAGETVHHTAVRASSKHRPTPLHLGDHAWQARSPISTGIATNRRIPSTPALTSCSRSVDTYSVDTLDFDIHHQHHRIIAKGSTLYLPIPEITGYDRGGISHSRSQVIEMFSPKNSMSYLTSPQGTQASHQCNQDIAEAFLRMKLDYKALALDWPIENENYAIRVPSDLGMRCDAWERKLAKLIVDTIENFGLGILTQDTANIALDTCAECLQWELPRDSIYKAIEKLREVLTPDIEYHDWCRHAPDIGSEEDVYPQETEYAVTSHYAAEESGLHHLHYYNDIQRSSPQCGDKSFDVDSELYFNAEFDD